MNKIGIKFTGFGTALPSQTIDNEYFETLHNVPKGIIETTLGFGKFVMQHEAFTSGNFDTHFVAKYFSPEKLIVQNDTSHLIHLGPCAAEFSYLNKELQYHQSPPHSE